MDAFEEFQADSFVSRLLGKGDVKGLAKKLEEVMPEAKQQELMEQMQKGNMTLRTFRSFLEQVGSMGSLSSVRLRLWHTLLWSQRFESGIWVARICRLGLIGGALALPPVGSSATSMKCFICWGFVGA